MLPFRLQVIIRIVLAISFGIGTYYFLVETPFWLMAFWTSLFFVLTTISLILFVEKSDRDLANFLMAIRQSDFTSTYPQTGFRANRLYRAFHLITGEFTRLRSEMQSTHHFLETVVEHSGVPLIAYTIPDEQVNLINGAAKELFGIQHLTKLHALSRVSPELVEAMRSLRSGERVLVKVELKGREEYLSVVVREVILSDKRLKVIACHSIRSELDQKELESWQKLIRVLTHEIKNSVIPISTLAEVLVGMFDDHQLTDGSLEKLTPEEQADLVKSIRTIEKRSKGLVKFVTSYGDMAKVPRPEPVPSDLVLLIREVSQLEEAQLKRNGITLTTRLPPNPIIMNVDKALIEQVLINLIKNAAEALLESDTTASVIAVSLYQDGQGVQIDVEDNGPGMDQELQDSIFIPFFTTKKEGSGIGLSYARQIMRAHKGSISVRSNVGNGTLVRLRF